jgi:hypothetical protein
VINWFLELRLYAETEKHSQTYDLSQTWRRLHAKFVVDRHRQELIRQYCIDNRLACPFFRDYTFTQEEFDAVEKKLLEALHLFIDDENRIYMPQGWYWTYPENHGWLWVELRRIKDTDPVGMALRQRLPQSLPNLPLPTAPEWGLNMKMTVLHTMKVDKHTEYLIAVETDLGKWAPYSLTYALKRYSDFEAFYQQLTAFIRHNSIQVTLPSFPDKGIGIHVTSKSAVAKRTNAFQSLLNTIASDPDLVSCPAVFHFFDVHPCPVAWRGLPYVRRCFLGLYN